MGPNERIASARRIARDGLAQQRAAAGGAAVWWGAPGFSMPRCGSFPASTAWVGSGMGYCADGTSRDLVGSKIAEAHVHWGKHRERVMVQHVVGESRQHNVVAQGSAGGTRDVEVRSVGKQDLQWMFVQWQRDQHAKRKVVEQEGHAWVSWQQELGKLRVLEARQQQIVGMAELAARHIKHSYLRTPRPAGTSGTWVLPKVPASALGTRPSTPKYPPST